MTNHKYFYSLINHSRPSIGDVIKGSIENLCFHAYFSSIRLDITDFSDLIKKSDPTQLRYFKAGKYLTEPLKDFDVLNFDYIGLSVVLEGVNLIDNRFKELKDELDKILDFPTHMNLYYTAPHSTGFPVHADGHDVLIIQLHGKKNWCIYPASVNSQTYDNSLPFNLCSDNFIFIEKGKLHGAYTKNFSSLHLTIGFHPSGF